MPAGVKITQADFAAIPGVPAAHGERLLVRGALKGLDAEPRPAGTLGNVQPIAIRRLTFPGAKVTAFFHDFYNRIYLLPSSVDFGPISGPVSVQFTLWNAFLTAKTVEGITLVNAEGLTLTGPATPTLYKPLARQGYTIKANDQGPPDVDARLEFAVTGHSLPYTLPVIGVRAFLTPFRPNWNQSVKISYEFRTEILKSRSGKEQRRALRSTPRKTIEYTTLTSFAGLRKANNLMQLAQARTLINPEYPRAALSSTGMAPGAVSIMLDDVPYWLQPDMLVCLTNGETIETRRVEGIAAPFVSFKSFTQTAWPPGTLLVAAVSGNFPDSMKSRRETNAAAAVSVIFNVTPASETPVVSGDSSPVFNGRELFLSRPNWGDRPSLDYEHESETLDFGRGKTRRFIPVHFGGRLWRGTYLSRDFATADRTREFFERMRGQRGEFYMPTWEHDLPPKLAIQAGTNTFRVEGLDVYKSFRDDTVFKALIVFKNDGGYIVNRVLDVFDTTDEIGADTGINCQDPWPETIEPSDVRMICWLPVWRFATDTLSLEWLTRTVAQWQLTMKTLEDLTPESFA